MTSQPGRARTCGTRSAKCSPPETSPRVAAIKAAIRNPGMSSSYAPTHRPEQSGRALGDPVRHPSGAPSPVLTKRAFVLILLTLLVPGSAQTVAGNRRLGRTALRVTLTVWALVIVALILLVVSRPTLINLFAGSVTSLVLVIVLTALALGWAVLFV